jgi:hypothetical protein
MIGRNAAPGKLDDSVLNTILDVKVRPTVEAQDPVPVPAPRNPVPKPAQDKHAEMKRRGEEKQRLLGKLQKKTPEPSITVTRPDVLSNSNFSESASGMKSKKRKEATALFEDVQSPEKKLKTSLNPAKPTVTTIHSDHKRQKMRERERKKRDKLRIKKDAKAERHRQKIGTKRPVNEPVEKPVDSIREMGMLLAKKLGRESTHLKSAYDSIRKSLVDV